MVLHFCFRSNDNKLCGCFEWIEIKLKEINYIIKREEGGRQGEREVGSKILFQHI